MRLTTITALGNAGFHVRHDSYSILIDPLWGPFAEAAGTAIAGADRIRLILITHDHWDHFSPREVGETASAHGARVLGPSPVIAALSRRISGDLLHRMDPLPPKGSGKCRGVTATLDDTTITAFRTDHGPAHNSYLIEFPGARLLHDGDNERVQCLDWGHLGPLDAVLLCPWQGSEWTAFLETVKPGRWFLQHMTEEEIRQHERGEFFPQICDRLPREPIVLRPGESREF